MENIATDRAQQGAEVDLFLEDLTAEELQAVVSAWKCSATLSTVACWGCGTLSSGSSFSSAGSG